jgi:PAS domain S-box-containing protein
MSLFARARPGEATPDRWKVAVDAALRVSDIASSGAPVPEAVQAVVRAALDLLEADQTSIMLVDETSHHLVVVAAAGALPGVPLGHRVRITEGIAGRVLATGRAVRLDQVDSTAYINFVAKQREIASSVVAPLRAGGKAIGVLNISALKGSRAFVDEDVRLAQLFADQAAGLIQRTKLHEQAERRSADLAALLEASQKLLGALDLDQVLQATLDGATSLVGCAEGFVCLMDPTSGAVSGGVFRKMDKAFIRAVMGTPEARETIERVSLQSVDVGGAHVVALGLRSTQGTRGLLVVPGTGETIQERGYLLRAFGQQCASVLGAAELYTLMQRKESELASIIQSVPNPIVLVDADHKVVSVNPSAETLFGISTMFCAGTPVSGVLGHQELEEMLSATGAVSSEVGIGTPARSYKVRVTDVRVPGAPMGRVLVMDDITTELDLVQTQRDFVAMIGHELRTPLTVVKGFTKLLLKRLSKGTLEGAEEALATIDSKTAQLERLIEDLLYVSKIETREATLRVDEVDVGRMIKEVATQLLEAHPDREIKLDLQDELQWTCDETKVALVLRHLGDNALKYSDPAAPVLIRATKTPDQIQIDVVDKGMGIVSSDIPHIFDRFHQLDGSSTRAHGGTGVGLYMCAQLVKVHQGRIWVDSTWGKGSTFSFSVPRGASRDAVVSLQGRAAGPRSA